MSPVGQLPAKLFNQPGLTDAGLANNLDELALARESAFRAASKDAKVPFTANKRGKKLGLSSAPSAADAQDAIEIHRRRGALELIESPYPQR